MAFVPRATDEVWRIAAAPFLHADYRHLIANSIPLLVLGYLVIIRNKWHFPLVFVCAVLVSGLGVWLFGSANSIHIGASGVVFGFMGYLLGRGFFERSIVSILFGWRSCCMAVFSLAFCRVRKACHGWAICSALRVAP